MKHYTHSCRYHEVMICKGRGPHAYQLKCVPCNKHLQWLSTKTALQLMSDLVKIKNQLDTCVEESNV